MSGGDGAAEACLDDDRLSYHCPMGGHPQPVEIALPPGRRPGRAADERVLHAARDSRLAPQNPSPCREPGHRRSGRGRLWGTFACAIIAALEETSGLICFDLSRWLTELSLHSPCKSLLLARWICGREARECGQARWATRVQRVVRGLSTRPEGRAPVRRTRPHIHRAVGRLASAGGVLSQDKAGLIATVDHADMRGLGTTGLHCVAELAFL